MAKCAPRLQSLKNLRPGEPLDDGRVAARVTNVSRVPGRFDSSVMLF
jgi:hypothetical protein